MALSNTATPKYYGQFRDAVIRGEIPVCKEISMEMNRIDDLIANPGIWYDEDAVEGFIQYCENELTLTDGGDLNLLDSFKLWAEQIFGWYYFVERSVYEPNPDGHGGKYVKKSVKKRLINKQYLIVTRGAAKSMYASCLQSYFLNVDTSTTHQITTAPTMKQAEEVLTEAFKDARSPMPAIVAVAKGEGRKEGLETLIRAFSHERIHLDLGDPALQLVLHIRDEAHRFAITGHRNRRAKARRSSSLEEIAGVGPKRRQALLQHLGGMQEVKRAGISELAKVPGISRELAHKIYDQLHGA